MAALSQLRAGDWSAGAESLARAWRAHPVDDIAPAALYALLREHPEVGTFPAAVSPSSAGHGLAISVVVCSVDEGRYQSACHSYSAALGDCPVEFIGIHDARSLAEGYMRGLGRCSGNVVIFSHDDVAVLSLDLASALHRALDSLDVVGVVGTARLTGPAWGWSGRSDGRGRIVQPDPADGSLWVHCLHFPEPVTTGLQALDGLFLAARREVASEVEFDAGTFDGFHLYDLDFSYRAAARGLRVGVSQDILLRHDSIGEFGKSWEFYAARFLAKFRLAAIGHAGPPLPRGIRFDSPATLVDACRRVDAICRSIR